MSELNILDLERIVIRGAASLAEGLSFYWPTSSTDNEINEANITLHLGRSLLNADFLVFSEANPCDESKLRLDMIGLHPPSRTALICEFKRLYNAGQAKKMNDDVERIKGFNLQQGPSHVRSGLGLENFVRYGLVAATTWDKDYADWFSSDSNKTSHPRLDPLWKSLSGYEPKTNNAFPLSYAFKQAEGRPVQHWLVYILFKM